MDNNTKEGPRAPFNQSAFHQPNAKERFYRYFQEEVTGMASIPIPRVSF
jgi:hypothetical protein